MQPKSLDIIQRLLDIDSRADEREILKAIEAFFDENIISFTRIPVTDGRYNILATKGTGTGGVLLCGHCDTVDPEPHYASYVQDGLLHGIGSSDMKSGLGACMQFLADYEGDTPLGVLVTVGEEIAFDGAKAALEHRDLFAPFSSAIVAEPTDLQPIASQNGLAGLWLYAEGVQRHTASFGDKDNPIHTLSEQIVTLRKAFGEQFPDCILSVNIFEGGHTDNIIPQQAKACVDIRLAPGTTLEQVRTFIDRHVTAGWEKRNWVEPVEEKDSVVLQELKRITKQEPAICKGFTEMYFYDKLGLQTVIIGPGLMENAHQKGETVPITNIQRFETILERIMDKKG